MLSKQRNFFEVDGWTLTLVEDFNCLNDFDCKKDDLNEFFQKDCFLQKQELLNTTYALVESSAEPFFPVGLVSLCNDAVRREKISWWFNFSDPSKNYPSYPAVKIARFGIRDGFQGISIGSHVINMIKEMFVTNNRTGCRLITLDAYNEPEVIGFYQKNHFQFFSDKDAAKVHRAMFFDLKRLQI